MIPYAGFPLSKCLVKVWTLYFSLVENLDWNHQECHFSRICLPSLSILTVRVTDISTSRNLIFPSTQRIKQEEEIGFSVVERAQTGGTGQLRAIPRSHRDDTSTNSGT